MNPRPTLADLHNHTTLALLVDELRHHIGLLAGEDSDLTLSECQAHARLLLDELRGHFAWEERALIPLCRVLSDAAPTIEQILAEHREIDADAQRLHDDLASLRIEHLDARTHYDLAARVSALQHVLEGHAEFEEALFQRVAPQLD